MHILNKEVVLKGLPDLTDSLRSYIDKHIANLDFDVFFVERVAQESLLNIVLESIFTREDFYDSLDLEKVTCGHFA